MDLVTLRTTLLITLSILLVVVLLRRFRRQVLANDLPAPQHAELLRLEVAYHPARLMAEVRLPEPQRIITGLVDHGHRPVHAWPEEGKDAGLHRLERMLPDALAAGDYYFEISTPTQRTVRRFRLQP